MKKILTWPKLLVIWFLAFFLILLTDIGFRIFHSTGICSSDECVYASQFVMIGELGLVIMGALFIVIMGCLLILGTQTKKEWIFSATTILLLGALSFDGVLLGFQFSHIGKKCQFCLAIGVFLLVTLFLYSKIRKSFFISLTGLAVWIGGFFSISVLQCKVLVPKVQEIPFLTMVHPDSTYPHYFLIVSMKCGHCLNVVANLGVNYPLPDNWSLCALTTKKEDVEKLNAVVVAAKQGENPFMEFFQIAQGTKDWQPSDIPDELWTATKKARSFFEGMGYTGIPVLIVQEGKKQRRYFQGDKLILNYLDEKGMLLKKAKLVRNTNGTDDSSIVNE